MNRTHRAASAILLTALAVTYPQAGKAEGFTGAEFLTWTERAQNSFIQSSLGMVGVIMTQTSKPNVATCIDRWYFASPALSTQRNTEIRKRISEFSTYHPQGVIAAFVKKACGPLP